MKVYALKGLTAVAVALAGVLAGQSDAHALGHHWGAASCGSWGGSAGVSHGSWGGSWGGSTWGGGGSAGSAGSAGSWGGHRRTGLLHRIFHRHRARRGSWGGSHGAVAYTSSAGSWGGSYGGASYGGASYGGSYGGGSYGGAYGGTIIGPAEVQGPAVMPEGSETPQPPTPPGGQDGPPPMTWQDTDSAALLTVSVPSDARVFVNDNPTTSTGDLRRYVSRGLTPGAAYTYRVRAEFTRNGEQVSEIKTVRLTAGSTASLDFSEPVGEAPIAANPVETKLTLHVPADAKVILAGNETQQSGEVRQFITSHLSPGQTWSDYVVRVEVERDGRVLSEEKILSLTGGESRELVVDLDAPKIAAR